jgi:uncharacterized MAPEG superfamily protein
MASVSAAVFPQTDSSNASGQGAYSRVFERALVAASTLPFFAAMALGAILDRTPSDTLDQLLWLLFLLNGLHVPATLYLYTDKEIRAAVMRDRMRMIVMPLALVVIAPLVFTGLYTSGLSWTNYGLIVTVLLFLQWQVWHFGMQSYGVLSFVSLTSGRRREPWQVKFERRTVIGGTMFGMLGLYQNAGDQSFIKRLSGVDYEQLDAIGNVLDAIGAVGCIACALAAVGYVFRHSRSFTVNSAIIYLVSVMFFLPDHLPVLNPDPNAQSSFFSATNFVLVHGFQYFVFLMVHALGIAKRRADGGQETRRPSYRKLLRMGVPIFYLIAITAGMGLTVMSPSFFNQAMETVLNNGSGTLSATTGQIFMFFIFGLTMAHFWVDQFFWKFSRPESKRWILDRFRDVLPPLVDHRQK